MKNEKLFRAIGGVGDDLIERAAQPVKKAAAPWLKWAALAACCTLMIGVVSYTRGGKENSGENAPDTAQTPAMTMVRSVEESGACADGEENEAVMSDSALAEGESAMEEYGTDWIIVNDSIYTRVYDHEEILKRVKAKTDGMLRGAYLGDVALSPWIGNLTGSSVYTAMFAEGVLETDEDGNATDSESNYVVVAVNSALEMAEPTLLLYRYVGEAPDLTQPLAAYIDENDAEYFRIYTADHMTYLADAPRAMLEELAGFGAQSIQGGWQDELEIYAGMIGERTWVLAATPSEFGMKQQNFAATDDGGETWQITGTENMYNAKVNGVAFCYPDVGFISYGCYDDDGPVIYKTIDGGMSWGRLPIEVPEELEGYRLEAQTPVFYSENGTYPIDVYRKDTGELEKTVNLVTRDGGDTWKWE